MTVVVDLLAPPPAEVGAAGTITTVDVDLTAGQTVALEPVVAVPAVTLDATANPDVVDLSTDSVPAPLAVDAAAGSTIDLVPGVVTVVELAVDGCVGPPGPPGPSGEASAYKHSQATAATVWTVHHLIPYPPAVTTVDSARTQLFGDVVYIDANTIEITFTWPTAGYAYLS